MHHIIYSNGKNGYGLYYPCNGFPHYLEDAVSRLYTDTPFASNQSNETNPLSLHFTSVTVQNTDYYVFSYVIRHCTHHDSQRIMFAAVNYVMDADEATECLRRPQETIPRIIACSEQLLTSCGYQFEAPTMAFDAKDVSFDSLSITQKTELMSVLAFLSVKITDRRLNLFQADAAQAITMLCWLFDRLPIHMRKYIRFYIGAQALCEAHRVEYVFSERMIGISTEKAPARPRVCVHDDRYIKTDGSPSLLPKTPDTVIAYTALSEQEQMLLRTLFYPSEDVDLFLVCAKRLYEHGQYGFFDEWALETLGDTWFANAVRANLMPASSLKALTAYDKLDHYPTVSDILHKQFPEQFAPPTVCENEPSHQQEGAPPEPQKPKRKKRGKREADADLSQSTTQTDVPSDDRQADYTELYTAYAPHSETQEESAPHRSENGDAPTPSRKESASAEVIFILFGALLSALMIGVLLLLSMIPAFLQGNTAFTAASITPRAFLISLIVTALFNMLIGSIIYQAVKTLRKRRRK